MVRVYIASPYSLGDRAHNVYVQLNAAHRLIEAGFAPFVPLLYTQINGYYHHPEETWLNIDLAFLRGCDCVLRLPGASKGADIETDHAAMLGLPVFHSVAELERFYAKV